MRKIKIVTEAVLMLCAAVLILSYPQRTAQGISAGLELCLNSIIPSIFPMMLVSGIVVECGYAGILGRMLAPLTGRLFGLPGEAGTAVILSLIGGYPAGARAVVSLYERSEVTREQAACMANFCFCAGPAFLIGVVGGITGAPGVGWLLMGVQVISVTLTGILVCTKNRRQKIDAIVTSRAKTEISSVTDGIVAAVSSTARAMLQVCLYVIIFSAVRELMDTIGLSGAAVALLTSVGAKEQTAAAIIPVLLEVTGGCISAVNAGLPLVAFAVGFGGISVQMQVLALTSGLGLKRSSFFLARLFQGTISALITAGAIELLPDGIAVTASVNIRPELSGSPQGAVMLTVMCVMWVLCMPASESTTQTLPRKAVGSRHFSRVNYHAQ